jgi:putative NAD(P)-binding protein
MKIGMLAASGCIGRQIVSRGIAAGLSVTAVVRRANATFPDPVRRVVCDDILDPELLRDAVGETDAVLSALGSRRMSRSTTVYSAGTAAALDAMREIGVRRFIGVTAAPVAPKGADVRGQPLDRASDPLSILRRGLRGHAPDGGHTGSEQSCMDHLSPASSPQFAWSQPVPPRDRCAFAARPHLVARRSRGRHACLHQ